MYAMDHSDMYSGLISQVERVFDLDRPEIELIKTDHSKYGVSNNHKCHVHDILILKIDDELFYAKGEDVYLRVSSSYSLGYRNFLEFSLSLFQLDDSVFQKRTFSFLDEPEIAPVSFERALVRRKLALIESITDDTDPGQITDPDVREMFVFYLSRKERLVSKDGAVYDDVFTHHGRDVIHEVLASVLGQLLQIPVPRNFFGLKASRYESTFDGKERHENPGYHRYVLSRAVHDQNPCPYLMDVLNKQFRERNIIWGLSLFREESNPLNLQFFQEDAPLDSDDLGGLIMANCAQYTDLIRSDFLDQLLGGAKDRKAFDYLLPSGLQGPIYTVDFGEILFPELMFDPGEPHYLAQKKARASNLVDYFGQVGELDEDNPYRKTIAGLTRRCREIDVGFINRLINAIPEKFFLDHSSSGQDCYQKATMVDFLENHLRIAANQHF